MNEASVKSGGMFLLKDVLEKLGVSQRQLAKRLGATQDWVARLYHCRNAPAWGTAVRIARALGVSVAVFADHDPGRDAFFQRVDPRPPGTGGATTVVRGRRRKGAEKVSA